MNQQIFFKLNNILNWILGKAILNRILNESFLAKFKHWIESDWVSDTTIPNQNYWSKQSTPGSEVPLAMFFSFVIILSNQIDSTLKSISRPKTPSHCTGCPYNRYLSNGTPLLLPALKRNWSILKHNKNLIKYRIFFISWVSQDERTLASVLMRLKYKLCFTLKENSLNRGVIRNPHFLLQGCSGSGDSRF